MAIEPKSPRKRAVKKISKKKAAEQSAAVDTTPETEAVETKSKKKAPSIPVPIFQAAPEEKAPKAAAKKSAKKVEVESGSDEKVSTSAAAPDSDDSEDSDGRGGRNRRRRRGGRGRRKPGADGADANASDEGTDSSEDSSEDSAEGTTHRRRRRRRATGEGVTPGETVDEDGVITVVKVREVRERTERPARAERNERGTRSRGRDRDRGGRNDNRGDSRGDYREPYRRRGTIITDGEFLARRENVDREMVVRQIGDRIQIAVIEDKVMVEHYVNRNANVSYVGNVYLGRVQNVLPSMEAAFVDIGKGRNAVLYAGEVNWDAAGISETQPRKIEMVLKTGQPVLVQVTKDPIGQKGARLTSQISLPGRYVVYVPGGGMSGISKRLPESERTRLKAILKNLIPEEAGVIVRTAAEGVSEEELTNDVARLKAQWEDIYQKSENPNFHAPALLLSEPDLAVRVIRDIFNEDFRKLTIQGNEAWEEISSYLGSIAPELVTKLEKYTGKGDLFADFRVEEQLAKAFDRKVYLPSGGSLVIDRTEAMIVIDVNTGKFIGKGGNLEETVTKNNLEAAEEIARQLRLRDLGGIIVIDFIDMVLESNRDAVLRRLVECLGRDRTKHQVAEVTSLGLVQMTRKRVGQGLIEAFSTTCDSCAGRGIHIHMEPVKMKAPMPQVNSQSASHDDADESEATEHEFHETLNTETLNTEVTDTEMSSKTEVDEDVEVEAKPAGRRRRRAASSGIITA
ncbi:ribonuclease E [Candidatus Planktophila lacus]|uniref:Rne/Rng family ribonuclease n=1 Tax=Candidatus Planktophila lacus TaxID=1884913 RepID=UPI000BAC6210|nr:Rne/Rng family ribonuclease [Candidatus Planktophila lacus]ASY29258.1 ribonuclease E [Candidatus Planktophila lacus]